jgi:hypothetical protein
MCVALRLYIRCVICESASGTFYAEGNKRKFIIKTTYREKNLFIYSYWVGTYAIEKALSTTYIFQLFLEKNASAFGYT